MLTVATVEAVSSHRIKIKLMLVYRYDKTLHMGCAGQCESVGEEVLLNSSLLVLLANIVIICQS